MVLVLEGIVGCFIVLICLVIGIANGPVNLVSLYEKEVQDRVVELGLITKEKISRNALYFMLFGMLPFFMFILYAVYGINGTRGFMNGFKEICVLLLMEGLFDRLFIDYWWVGKTEAWIIEGTEDLMPYIYGKTLIAKWLSTLVGYPLMALILSYVMSLLLK